VLQVNIFRYDKHIPEIPARFDVIFKLETVGVWAVNGKRFVLTGKILWIIASEIRGLMADKHP
jgi:hypothetical protein